MAKDYARKKIDPSRAVSAEDLLKEFAEWHDRLFSRFAAPNTKSGSTQKAAEPVLSKEGRWMEFTSDESIKCFWRVSRKSLDLWEELACLRNGVQYTETRPEGHVEPLKLVAPSKPKKAKSSKRGRRSS